VEILYPLAHQCQRELWGDRIYRLSELSAEAYFYDDEDSDPQIGVILTPEPVVLAPWLERSFVEAGLVIRTNPTIYARVDFPRIFARVEADIRIRLGSRCAPVFVVAPICAPPRPAREGRGPRHDADNRKRDHGRHEDPAPSWHAPDFPPEPGRRAFERRGPEMRRVNEPSRPPAGRQDRAASDTPQYKARGRNESPQPAKAGNEGNSNTRSRRERKASR